MCIAIYKPEGKRIKKERLETCYDNNPDGAGFMYIKGGKLKTQKGYFSFKSFWKAYNKAMREDQANFPAVLHFRIATHGTVNTDNCHPHRIKGTDIFMAHNGIISIDLPKKCKHSDTVEFCNLLSEIEPKESILSEPILSLIEGFIGTSKIVFMKPDGTVKIVNEDLGLWEKGSWYSNDTYKTPYYYYAKPTPIIYRNGAPKDTYIRPPVHPSNHLVNGSERFNNECRECFGLMYTQHEQERELCIDCQEAEYKDWEAGKQISPQTIDYTTED